MAIPLSQPEQQRKVHYLCLSHHDSQDTHWKYSNRSYIQGVTASGRIRKLTGAPELATTQKVQDLADLPHQQAYENTLLEYWCGGDSHRTNTHSGASGFAVTDFKVRSELATCDSVPREHQERFEIGIRRNNYRTWYILN